MRISLALVASLHEVVRQTDGDLQGVLRGTRTPQGTEVSNCRPVPSFSPDVMARAAADKEVVGYYRVRNAETIRLSEVEVAIAEASFGKPGAVVLLIQRREEGGQANFFFRENGALVNLSLLMFPLDPALLERSEAVAAPMLPAAAAPPNSRRGWIGVAGAAAVLVAGLTAGGWYLRHRERTGDVASAAPVSAPLPLRAERQGDDLKVIWDLDSATVANAVSGVLDIEDGGVKRRIPLDQRQVRFGSVLYTPQSDEVSIDLTAVKVDGTAGQASVLVLLRPTASGKSAPEVRNVAKVSMPAPGADRRVAMPPVARPFVPPPEKQPAVSSQQPDALPAAQLQAQPVATVRLPAIAAPAPPPAQNPTKPVVPAPAQASAPAPAPAPVFVGPELVSQVGVRVPPELRGFIGRPMAVTVRAAIDETGRVKHAEIVPEQKVVHVGLQRAATEAAMRCRFRPARRGNTPVPGEALITFHFDPVR